MLLPLPGVLETSLQPKAGRPLILTIIVTTILITVAVLPRLGWSLGDHGWAEPLVRTGGLLEASWTLYSDSGLFAPWQLWTWVCVDDASWWWLANIVMVAVLTTHLEQRLGILWPLLGLLGVLPWGAVVYVLGVPPTIPVQVGAGACVAGLSGFSWGFMRPARLRYGLGWWAVIVVGWIPLGSISLPALGVVWAVADALIHDARMSVAIVVVDLLVLGVGMALGLMLRNRYRRFVSTTY